MSFKNKVCPGIVFFYIHILANSDFSLPITIRRYMPAIVGAPDSQLSRPALCI